MGRNKSGARRRKYRRLDLDELARKAGLGPRQKLEMLRYIKKQKEEVR